MHRDFIPTGLGKYFHHTRAETRTFRPWLYPAVVGRERGLWFSSLNEDDNAILQTMPGNRLPMHRNESCFQAPLGGISSLQFVNTDPHRPLIWKPKSTSAVSRLPEEGQECYCFFFSFLCEEICSSDTREWTSSAMAYDTIVNILLNLRYV